jgi:hypothetical protein
MLWIVFPAGISAASPTEVAAVAAPYPAAVATAIWLLRWAVSAANIRIAIEIVVVIYIYVVVAPAAAPAPTTAPERAHHHSKAE